MQQPVNQYRQVRVEKLEKLKAMGIEPWPAKAKRTHGIARVVHSYFYDMTNEEYAAAGIKNCQLVEYAFE